MSRTMKDSGIPWIGEIPSHWKLMPHKWVMHKEKEIREKYHGETILSLTMKGVIVRDLDAGGKMPSSFDGYQAVYPNDLLQCLFDIDVTPRCVGLVKNEGLVSPAYSRFVLHSNGYTPYYDYLLRYMDDNKVLLHLSKNLRSSLTETDFGAINTCVPPIPEQQAIADFLDEKCSEIDEMVSLQEKIVEELKAYKQSVITEAVCKGLNPDVPMKDSGIEWIGQIPESWRVAPFKSVYSLGKGLSITKADLVSKGVPVISYGQIHSKQNTGTSVADDLIRFVPESFLSTNSDALVKIGDVIFADTSEDLAGCGNCVYIDRGGLLFAGYHTIIARNETNDNNNYFSYLFQTDCWRKQIRSVVNGVKLYSVPQRLLSSTSIIIPPIEEQREIGSFLDNKCSEIDALISLKQSKIDFLKEYKKSIIYEYITGKKEING